MKNGKGLFPIRLRRRLFVRFSITLLLLTLFSSLTALYFARQTEQKRNLERLEQVALSNSQMVSRFNLPRSARYAKELSSTSGVTILFSGPDRKLTSPRPLSDLEQNTIRKALDLSGKAKKGRGFEVVARSLPSWPGESLIALQPTQNPYLFRGNSLTYLSLISAIILALSIAIIFSKTVISPLQILTREIQNRPYDQALELPSSLQQRQDEIGILSQALSSSRDQLIEEQKKRQQVERLALLGQLTTSLAHEIKNPAASIIMHAQNLESGSEALTGTLIKEESEQIVSLVDQWLYVAKPEGAQNRENDLTKIIKHLVEKLKALLDFHQITVSIEAPDSLFLTGDAKRLEQVFRNLIDNAIHAMPMGGLICIKLKELQDSIEFSIQDQGGGFSEQALKHFGEAFYSEREGGLGLGLTLICGVVQAHQGSVQAKNLPDGGAIVTGRLAKKSNEK